MIEKASFPLVWDNSMRVSFITCPWKFSKEYLSGYRAYGENPHLHAGKAWAEALESARRAFYIDNLPELDAEAHGLKALLLAYGTYEPPIPYSNKSLPALVRAFIYYFRLAFPMSTDPVQPLQGKTGPMIEFSFALPLSKDLLHPVTGEPIIYTGRADLIATYAGAPSVYDDKTTGALGSKWGDKWTRRSQFTAYTWAARAFGIPVSQVVVRGICLLKHETKHAQIITHRTPFQIEEWHLQMVADISRAMEMWKSGFWHKNLADACENCVFQTPCGSPNSDQWLNGGTYSRIMWDPLTRTETRL